MYRNKTIGILGGMGPAATANFLRLFVSIMNARGVCEDGDFPHIIIRSIPLADWDETGAIDKNSVAKQVRAGVWNLILDGAEIIAIPCNTVHEFHDLYANMGATVLHIVKETLRWITGDKIAVLCSRQSRDSGLFARERLELMYWPNQEEIDDIIGQVCAGKRPSVAPHIQALRHRGATSVVLGCTELSLCERNGLPVIDSSEALARALAEWVLR